MSHGYAFSTAMLRKARVWTTVCFALTLVLLLILSLQASESSDDDARRAVKVLQQNCATSGCHGGAGAYSFDAADPRTLIDAKVIQPGNAAGSEVISRLESGAMPLGGYQGKAGVKLPDADIQTLKRWIDAGAVMPAPAAKVAGRQFISESDLLKAIARDLEGAPEVDRRFYRYYSFVNLWNTTEVDDSALAEYRTALGRLVNHLSWSKDIVTPRPVVAEGVILRVDLRDYGWTIPLWNDIVAVYPYAVVPNDLGGDAERIRALSGAIPPYIRADWFTARASVAPLYHDILQLPDTLEGLERRLSVDAMGDVRSGRARRFGVQDSGVSRNNRAMERHSTPYGAYWKSFDFNGNRIEQNIFRDPVHLTPDGGEIIFNLPNGLQGYFIVDSKGRRIDAAPVAIVRDRTNPDDPVVHNGRSCIGCHFKGMNTFSDDIAPSLQSRTGAVFEMTSAMTLYRGQSELDRLLSEDNVRFRTALERAGGSTPSGAAAEPVNQLARRYERTLSVQQAAVELNIENPGELQKRIEGSVEIQKQGFDPLLGPKGGIQRDTWEQGFGRLAQEFGIGRSAFPNALLNIPAGTTLRLELVDMLDVRAARVGDIVWFRTSDDLRVAGRMGLTKGALVRGAITQIQPGAGPNGTPAFQFALDQALPVNGPGLRLPASFVTLKDFTGAPNTTNLIGGMTQVINAVNGNRGAGWNGGAAALATARGPATPVQSPNLPRGAMFEARF